MWREKAEGGEPLAFFTPFKSPVWSLTMAERALIGREDRLIDQVHKKLFFLQEAKCLTETA